MRTHVIKIGNSQGLRIPKPVLEQTGIVGDVEMEVADNQIIIRPVQNPREGWGKAFEMIREKADDSPFLDDFDLSNSWDEEEWR